MTLLEYLGAYKKVLAFGGGAASLPLIASFASIQPPWPPGVGPISSAVVLVAALVAWEWVRNARLKNRRMTILVGFVVAMIALFLYLYLYSRFIDTTPDSSFRVVRGYVCTPNAKLVYGSACPNLPADALQDAGWETTELWTRASITNVRVMLAASWLLFTFCLGLAVGAVVAGRKV